MNEEKDPNIYQEYENWIFDENMIMKVIFSINKLRRMEKRFFMHT